MDRLAVYHLLNVTTRSLVHGEEGFRICGITPASPVAGIDRKPLTENGRLKLIPALSRHVNPRRYI